MFPECLAWQGPGMSAWMLGGHREQKGQKSCIPEARGPGDFTQVSPRLSWGAGHSQHAATLGLRAAAQPIHVTLQGMAR